MGFSKEFLPVGQVERGGGWERFSISVLASVELLTFPVPLGATYSCALQPVSCWTSPLLSSLKGSLECACAER